MADSLRDYDGLVVAIQCRHQRHEHLAEARVRATAAEKDDKSAGTDHRELVRVGASRWYDSRELELLGQRVPRIYRRRSDALAAAFCSRVKAAVVEHLQEKKEEVACASAGEQRAAHVGAFFLREGHG